MDHFEKRWHSELLIGGGLTFLVVAGVVISGISIRELPIICLTVSLPIAAFFVFLRGAMWLRDREAKRRSSNFPGVRKGYIPEKRNYPRRQRGRGWRPPQ